MEFNTRSAIDYPIPELVEILNRGFENYFVPIQFSPSQFNTMLRKDSIDLDSSCILLIDGQPSGIALIARRGWTSRIAAMGVAQPVRGKGAGSWLMEKIIQESRQRGDHEMELEVIEQNENAVHVYKKSGFQIVRRLVGFVYQGPPENGSSHLEELDLREVGHLITRFGLPDLPWQLSGETITLMNPPVRAYRKGQAYAVISNPDAEHVVIWSLLVHPDARGNRFGLDMLKSLAAEYSGKTWHIPAILPEELRKVYEDAGFEKEKLSQWQMKLTLIPSALS